MSSGAARGSASRREEVVDGVVGVDPVSGQLLSREEYLAAAARATHLETVTGTQYPTTLRLAGDVGPVLRSTCVWEPEPAGPTGDDLSRPDLGGSGSIRAVELAASGLPFGLGAGAFGQPAAEAVTRLGEFVLVSGEPWWTPAVMPAMSRHEPPESAVLTPFLFQWDRMSSATARLDSAVPVPLVYWYEYLLRELTAAGICGSGTLAIQVVADLPAPDVVDKQLIRAPLRRNAPAGTGLITDDPHLDDFFLRNAAARAFGDAWLTALMVGVVIDPEVAARTWGDRIVDSAFYTTPGIATAGAAMHHTHALVARRLAGSGDAQRREAADAPWRLAEDLAASDGDVQATHIENDTLLRTAMARIGAVQAIHTDTGALTA